MAIPNRVFKKMTNTRLKLSDLNPHLMCVLCGGYYIDATTIVECLHSFCRSCIVKHLEGSKYCPICEVQVHKTKPLINIRPDKTLQDIVYKLVPGLYANEMQNRRVFYQERPHYIKPDDSESVGEVSGDQKIYVNGENITFSLIYLDGPSPVPVEEKYKELTTIQSEVRYFRCPTAVSIQHLKKLLKAKYELRGNNYKIDIFFKDDALNDEYTLLDISYIYLWKTEAEKRGESEEEEKEKEEEEVNEEEEKQRESWEEEEEERQNFLPLFATNQRRALDRLESMKENLTLTFKIYENPVKRRRRRYFGGVNELPAHFTPLSILQSRLGILADSLSEDMAEGRRHLRSDIEKKRKEIEMRLQEERKLSERELRSHDDKKKDKEKDGKNTEVKKKNKSEEKKKDKDGKSEKKKEGKSSDEKKRESKGGEEKKKDVKSQEEKKRKKEGRCHEDKRTEKDDKEDRDEKRKDKDAKEERNREMKGEGDNKRKREGEREEKRKREKREEIKENHIDKRDEPEENGYEKMTTGEVTTATSSESVPSPTSTQTPVQAPASSSSDLTQSSGSTEEGSVSTTTTNLDSTSEPTSTTTVDSEQKTEESHVSSESSTSRENRATPLKESEVQLQISESGVMSVSQIVENAGDVRTVEERVNERLTRRSSITGTTSRDEGVVKETKKRGSSSNISEGSPKDPNRKSGPKSTKTYKTIRSSPNVWHPSIPKEKLRSTLMKNSEEARKPPKFFKLRNKSRVSENPSNEGKPVQGDPVLRKNEEEEEPPQHEIEKEETQVEPQSAQVATRDEVEEKKMEEEKRRVEEEKRQNEEEKGRLEEDEKMETTQTNPEAEMNGDTKTVEPLDKSSTTAGDTKTSEPLDKEETCSTVVSANTPNLPTNLKGDPKTFGPLEKEDRCSTIVGANAPDLPNNLKGDPKTFGPLDKEDQCSTIVGANAPDLPTNLKDPIPFGPLDMDDKCSMIVGASAPDLPTNLKGNSKGFEPVSKKGKCSAKVGGSAPDVPTNLKGDKSKKILGSLDKKEKSSTSSPKLPTNPKGDRKTFGTHDKEDRCSNVVTASAPNLLTNPFIPNSNHFLFSDVTLPPNSGNYSKSSESKVEKSIRGKAVPGSGSGLGGVGATGLGVSSGIGSSGFKNLLSNGGTCSSLCFLDPLRLVYPFQSYPETDPLLRVSRLPSFGKMTGFNSVSGCHASLPPCINHLSSPHQNVLGMSLVSAKKNKEDSTKERVKTCSQSLNPSKTDDKDRKKRCREVDTEVTKSLKTGAQGTETNTNIDGKAGTGEEEEDEDDERIFVPAKKRRDEKGSEEKEEDVVTKEPNPKEDKPETEQPKGNDEDKKAVDVAVRVGDDGGGGGGGGGSSDGLA